MTSHSSRNFGRYRYRMFAIGYPHDFRQVPSNTREARFSCKFTVFKGRMDRPDDFTMDCNVIGQEALKLLKQFQSHINAQQYPVKGKPTVLMKCMFLDEWIESDVVKTRLYKIFYVEIKGQRVHTDPSDSSLADTSSCTAVTPSNKPRYYDFHTFTTVILRDIRLVEKHRGQPYHASRIIALQGSWTEPEKLPMDCNIVGKYSLDLLKQYEPAINGGHVVTADCMLGDQWIDPYVPSTGDSDLVLCIKARLLKVFSILIDGNQAHPDRAEAGTASSADADAPSPPLPLNSNELPASSSTSHSASAAG